MSDKQTKKCSSCSEDIQIAAKKCKHCGADLRSWISRHPILSLLLVLLGIGLVGSAANQDKSKSEIFSQKGGNNKSGDRGLVIDRTVSAQQLVQDYIANEVKADNMYKGKVIKISGAIEKIGKDILDDSYITFKGDGIRSVQCFFEEKEVRKLADLNVGDMVTIIGRGRGLMGNVLVKECEFVK